MIKIKHRVLLIVVAVIMNCNLYSQYHYYYGTIHSHSSYSDGNKDSVTSLMTTPYQDYEYAKHSLHIDYLGISEHNHLGAGMHRANYHKGIQQADSANEDGVFVCLYGMEWGEIANGGHVIVYGFDSLIGWDANNFDIYNGLTDYTGLFQKIAHKPGAFAYFAHPTTTDFNNIYSSTYNAVSDSAIIGTPFRSGPAFSTDTIYSDPSGGNYLNRYYDALKKGYHLGIGIDHDTHNSVFGRSQKARTVVLADTLTQYGIMDAYRNMRFYASDDWNAKIDFTVNGQVMGSVFSGNGSPSISISSIDPDGEGNTNITIFKGVPGSGIAPTALTSNLGSLSLNFSPAINNGETYYYFARVLQSDGDQIFTSPIWYTRNDNVGVTETSTEAVSVINITPNPARGEFIFSFHVNKMQNLLLDVYDMYGKLMIHQRLENITGTYAQQMQLPSASKGIYLIRLTGEGINRSQKIVVE